ncbi:MAG: tRNA (adenosine(37)-N6)-threonylcarbamoyltransferase complex dimerization subunit type 1 TsaB [Flavobacteriales bacterium]
MSSVILNIESSTTNCSVALGKAGQCIDLLEINDGYSHAEKLAPFVNDMLQKHNHSVSDLDAIAVSMGPGSYTGLRIGVSLAKGLCYSANKPLISVSTLQLMCLHPNVQKQLTGKDSLLCPMLDARRMEVYSAVYDKDLNPVEEIRAKILDESSFEDLLEQGPILFFGTGSDKFKPVVNSPNATFVENIWPSAREMCSIAQSKLKINAMEDVAYFEPYYLKDFMATTPKKLL